MLNMNYCNSTNLRVDENTAIDWELQKLKKKKKNLFIFLCATMNFRILGKDICGG